MTTGSFSLGLEDQYHHKIHKQRGIVQKQEIGTILLCNLMGFCTSKRVIIKERKDSVTAPKMTLGLTRKALGSLPTYFTEAKIKRVVKSWFRSSRFLRRQDFFFFFFCQQKQANSQRLQVKNRQNKTRVSNHQNNLLKDVVGSPSFEISTRKATNPF